MSSPILALRDAIQAALKAAPEFTAIATGKRIYDEIPSGAGKPAAPYAYIGPMRQQQLPNECGQFWTVQARLYAVSTGFGRDTGWNLIDVMTQALHLREQDTMPLAAPFRLQKPIEVTQAGDVIDPLAAKSVFLDLTTIISRSSPDEED